MNVEHENTDGRIDRLLQDRLSAAESRRLAQDALEDDDLFGALTAASLVKNAVGEMPPDVPVMPPAQKPRPSIRGWAWAASAVAASLAAAFFLWPGTSRSVLPSVASQPKAASPTDSRPILLAEATTPRQQVFRSAIPSAQSFHEPKPVGSVISVEDGNITVDLGAADGLTKGALLKVNRLGQASSALKVQTVFRTSARATQPQAGAALVLPGEHVQNDPNAYLAAVDEFIAAIRVAGNPPALTAARKALAWSRQNGIPSRNLARIVGALEYAEEHFDRSLDAYLFAANLFDALPAAPASERIAIWNNAGAAAERSGDRARARQLYQQALNVDGITSSERADVTANLSRAAQPLP